MIPGVGDLVGDCEPGHIIDLHDESDVRYRQKRVHQLVKSREQHRT